jgi:hypothetical protein
MSEKATRYIPRWLHYSANIAADAAGFVFTDIPPNAFANETIWPFRLETLTLSGLPPFYGTPLGDFCQFWGGLGTCVNLELGISGCSDVNQVTATAGTIMAHRKRFVKAPVSVLETNLVVGIPNIDDGAFHRFKYPYLLARGNGFNVTFVNNRDDWQYDAVLGQNGAYNGFPAFAAYGRGVTSGQPVMLAGTYRMTDRPNGFPVIASGSGITFNSSDLLNDGHEDVLIDTIGVTYPYQRSNVAYVCDSTGLPFQVLYGLYSNYLINPINGPKWMPGSEPISAIEICPFEIPTPLSGTFNATPQLHVPAVYEFPPDTVLLRRQNLSVRLGNNTLLPVGGFITDLRANVTLFGYLEVR